MTLGDRHLSDPPGALYSNPYCLSPSYHDPWALDHISDPSPKPSSPSTSLLDPPRQPYHGSTLQSQPQLHTGNHATGRAHTIHGGASDMRRLMETSSSHYDQLFPFTDDISLPSMHQRSPPDHSAMRGSSPVNLPSGRSTSPSRIGASHGMRTGGHPNTAPAPFSHLVQPFAGAGPQRTNSDTSGMEAPLDMAFLDIPGGSPTHNTPPWTPRSNAFLDQEDPLMQPLPHLDAPTHSVHDLTFPQHAVPAQMLPLQQQPVQLRAQHAQHAQQQPFSTAQSLPRASSNGGSMSLSGVRDDSALQRRTHSPALSDAGMQAPGFGEGALLRTSSGPSAEQRSLAHVHTMPARVGVDGGSDMHVQDTFGGNFAIHPHDPPRAEVSGMSREKSLRLLHSSITSQSNDPSALSEFLPLAALLICCHVASYDPAATIPHTHAFASTPSTA